MNLCRANHRPVPKSRRLSRVLLWLLALLGVASIASCVTPQATSEQIVPTHTASRPPTSTAGSATATALPTPTASEVPTVIASPTSTVPAETPTPEDIPIYTYRIVNVFPHDQEAYTQGLLFEDGVLYEGTGLWGLSTLRRVELETGDVLQLYSVPPQYYGEGITIWEDRVIQLTWKAKVGFVYDKKSFELLGAFYYPTEGWGITHDGTRLIMSDGTSILHFWNPETFEEVGRVQVHDDHGPVTMLNELEYIRGGVYANVWHTERIAIIDPQTGRVTAWIDLAGLLAPADASQLPDMLNGIAYDADGDRLFVTIKQWPKLFEIELVPEP